MSERSQELYLSDIIESINAIEDFVLGYEMATFAGDRKTYSATIRELEIIGEAIRNISDEIKVQYPEILWQAIRSFRNKITHEYFGIDVRIVWDVVTNELPILKKQVEQIQVEWER
jgi:uncharacterized protein with HEPN domain